MGRLFRTILVLGAAVIFGILTERNWAEQRCQRAGGIEVSGICMAAPTLGNADG